MRGRWDVRLRLLDEVIDSVWYLWRSKKEDPLLGMLQKSSSRYPCPITSIFRVCFREFLRLSETFRL